MLERTAAATAEMPASRFTPPLAPSQPGHDFAPPALAARRPEADAHPVAGNGQGHEHPLARHLGQTVAAGADGGDGQLDLRPFPVAG